MLKTTMVVAPRNFTARLVDYGQLFKLRLASLVVLSAALAFLIGSTTIDYTRLWLLVLGGFLVTGSSNGLNQIYERRTDKIMKRTRQRPLPDSRMSLTESLIVTIAAGLVGLFILTYFINLYSGILGLIALVSYAFAYTPLKVLPRYQFLLGRFRVQFLPCLAGLLQPVSSVIRDGYYFRFNLCGSFHIFGLLPGNSMTTI